MTFVKHRIAAALAVIAVASLVTLLQVEANHETDDQFGEEAIWNPADSDLTAISQACKNNQAAGFNDCFVDQMGEYASSDAVAFLSCWHRRKRRALDILRAFANPVWWTLDTSRIREIPDRTRVGY